MYIHKNIGYHKMTVAQIQLVRNILTINSVRVCISN